MKLNSRQPYLVDHSLIKFYTKSFNVLSASSGLVLTISVMWHVLDNCTSVGQATMSTYFALLIYRDFPFYTCGYTLLAVLHKSIIPDELELATCS